MMDVSVISLSVSTVFVSLRFRILRRFLRATGGDVINRPSVLFLSSQNTKLLTTPTTLTRLIHSNNQTTETTQYTKPENVSSTLITPQPSKEKMYCKFTEMGSAEKKTKRTMKNNQSIPPRLRTSLLLLSAFLVASRIQVHVDAFAPFTTQKKTFQKSTDQKNIIRNHRHVCTNTAVQSQPVIENAQEQQEENNSMDEYENDYSCYPPRNPLLEGTNVITYPRPIPNKAFIESFAPPSPNPLWERFASSLGEKHTARSERRIGVDVTVEFRDAKCGAADMVQQCLASSNQSTDMDMGNEMKVTEEYIADILSLFQKHIHVSDKDVLCKARIVSSIGSVGQKCPRWHVDHVPLRLVMSLAGPGCIYVPIEKERKHPKGVDRDALNGLDEDDSTRANLLILPNGEQDLAVYAEAGDAVLLMGRAWSESSNKVPAAPHRSPEIEEDQLRILLVVDVVPEMLEEEY